MSGIRRTWLVMVGVLWVALAGGALGAQAVADGALSLEATATNCLQPDGEPYEQDGNVYQKIKNVCTTRVAVEWTVETYNFGVQSTPIGTPRTGTVVIEPGKTYTLCSPKPTTPGRYCFRFKIKNFDKTKPFDWFTRWLNNIVVAAVRGGGKSGTFGVGGSGLITSDVYLAQSGTVPPGWFLSLSTNYVPAADFPATVSYTIFAPANAPRGQRAVFLIEGYDAETGDQVGDATIQATLDVLPVEPLEVQLGKQASGRAPAVSGAAESDLSASDGEPGVVLTWAEEQLELSAVTGRTYLLAWQPSERFEANPKAVFEVLGPDGWSEIGTERNRPRMAQLGAAMVKWDTSELDAGLYTVRVTMVDDQGQKVSATRQIQVAKRPTSVAEGFLFGENLSVDGSASFDPDGEIVEWHWDFGDGKTADGPQAFHTFADASQSYPVTLTVTDGDGFETDAYCLADLAKGAFVCAATCGCASMDIKCEGDGPSGIPMPWMPAGSNTTLGPVNTIPQPPGSQPGPFSLIYNFEVVATLTPGSDPALCSSHQWAKGTTTAGGGTGHKTDPDGNEYPASGDALGDDNYTGNSSVQTSGGGTIRWVDGPGFGDPAAGTGLTPGQVAAGPVSMVASFFAMVTGPAGTCSCSWDVEMKVNADGSVATPPTLKNESCS
ncbi:MAG TPA: PKD domain-containing protein [Thermoanaerobaculia bacterium]|nr:PKD domain-containing protein [Thermoanaerobaculia bacterium]